MRNKTWLLFTLYGVLLASAVSAALKGTRKFKIATTSTTTTTTEEPNETDGEDTTAPTDVNATTARVLTGIPQIDYIWDPNLPRELNGYNLSDYPFYERIPKEEIDFKCDGLHDGFYASVPHKCQVYHHCLYGTRYDFLCANFTAFDQKTFICHFASEVDCANSKKYWHRNDALYKAAETTTVAPPTTTTVKTTTTSQAPTAAPASAESPRLGTRRRRPFRRRPAYDYYEEEYYDDEYDRPRTRGGGYDRRDDYEYEERAYNRREHMRNRDRDYREPMRPRYPSRAGGTRRDPVGSATREPEVVEDDRRGGVRNHDDRRYDRGFVRDEYDEEPTAPATSEPPVIKPAAPSGSLYSRPRAPPKIRRPVPLSEKDRYSYKATSVQPSSGDSPKRSTTELPPPEEDYYEDEVEDARPRRPMRRRPYRERERYFHDQSRDMRDRAPMRTRYRDEEEEVRPRKHPERPQTPHRLYERNRDRALDRTKPETVPERPVPERESVQKVQEPQETPRRPQKPIETTTNAPEKIHPIKEVAEPEPETQNERDYPAEDDYYDEPEYSSPLPPRSSVRIVKRPFLPSRGGNPNPRGLSPVGKKAPETPRKESRPTELNSTTPDQNKDHFRISDGKLINRRPAEASAKDEAQVAHKNAQKWTDQVDNDEVKPAVPWHAEDFRRGPPYSEQRKDLPVPSAKARINEVPHSLQDIPESEYDVALNEALTPAFNHDTSLPSGFVLPHHRAGQREPVLQPSENNYRVSRPYQQQSHQNTFVPSPQFIPARISNNDERSGSVQYFKTPEVVHGPAVSQRQPVRGTWHDYAY